MFPDDATVEVEEDDPELAPELTLGAGAKVSFVADFTTAGTAVGVGIDFGAEA